MQDGDGPGDLSSIPALKEESVAFKSYVPNWLVVRGFLSNLAYLTVRIQINSADAHRAGQRVPMGEVPQNTIRLSTQGRLPFAQEGRGILSPTKLLGHNGLSRDSFEVSSSFALPGGQRRRKEGVCYQMEHTSIECTVRL